VDVRPARHHCFLEVGCPSVMVGMLALLCLDAEVVTLDAFTVHSGGCTRCACLLYESEPSKDAGSEEDSKACACTDEVDNSMTRTIQW